MKEIWNITFDGKLMSPNIICHWTRRYSLNKKWDRYIQSQYYQDKPNLILPAHIELIRISPREYDYDNLVSSFKGVRDSLSMLFFPEKNRGQADNSKELTWNYIQKKGIKKQYRIQIRITGKEII